MEEVEVIDDAEADETENVIFEPDMIVDPGDVEEMPDAEMTEDILVDTGNLSAAEAKSGDYEYKVYGENATLMKYTGSAKFVVVPSTIDGYTVTCLSGTFNKNVELTEVVLPNTLTSIIHFK